MAPRIRSAPPCGANYNLFNDVVGFYSDDQGLYHGMVIENGVASTLDYPDPTNTGTYLYGINNSGTIVGGWTDGKQRPYAFLYDPSTRRFTNFVEKHVKHGRYAQTFGLNNAGLVAVNFPYADGPFIYCPHPPSQCPAGGKMVSLDSIGLLPSPAQPHRAPPRAKTGQTAVRFANGVLK